ncbi:MAG: hypothetical protein MJ099_02560, partial [Clostridia bacterium]|nr:hypothetical protein [Clostridia bacterium]
MVEKSALLKRKDIAVCLISAFVILMLLSLNSYLYPVNPWDDVNIFFTVGQGILDGKMPYRDLIDQKGPLAFLVHSAALLISPGNYHGIFWFELVALTATLLIMLRTARRFRPQLSAFWMTAVAAVICLSPMFSCGDSAEEMLLPFLALTMDAIVAHGYEGRTVTYRTLLVNGMGAGVIAMWKYSLLGLPFAFMAFLAIEAVIEDRGLLRAVKMCLVYLLGMAAVVGACLLWAAACGFLSEFLSIYLLDNATQYGTVNLGRPFWFRIAAGTVRCLILRRNFVFTAVLALSVLNLFFLEKRVGKRMKAFVFIAAVIATACMHFNGVGYTYYAMGFVPFAVFCLPLADRLLSRLPFARFGGIAVAVLALAAVIVLGKPVPFIGSRYEDSSYHDIAGIVNADADNTLMNFGSLDMGYYMACGVSPDMRYFCRLNCNPDQWLEETVTVLNDRSVRYVVANFTSDAIESIEITDEWQSVALDALTANYTPIYSRTPNGRIYKDHTV